MEVNENKEPKKLDLFEYAAMKTFAKVNKIRLFNNGVTIGPNSSYIQEYDAASSEDIDDYNKENVTVDNCTVVEVDEVHDLSSYATKALHEMENIRRIHVSDNVNDHISQLKRIEDELLYKMNENLKLTKHNMISKDKLKPKKIESSISNEDLLISQRMYELMKRYADVKIDHPGTPELDVRAIEEIEAKLRNGRISNLCLLEENYRTVHEQIVNNTMSCKNCVKLMSMISSELQKIEELNIKLNCIIGKVKLIEIDDQDVENCKMLLYDIIALAEVIQKNSDQINAEEEHEPLMDQQLMEAQEKQDLNKIEYQKAEVQLSESAPNLKKSVCKESLEIFVRLSNNREEFTKKVEAFVDSIPSKSFLRKLKIAISTPLNALSSVSASHMRDKYIKISQFLRGDFTIPNTELPNIPRELYFVFVVDYLCKQIINHAGKRFAPSKPEEAYLLGSFVVALWVDYPIFGSILLADIMKECPYCIPAYWPRIDGQTDQEYYVSLGYQCKNDEIEDESSFLGRMTGIFMLYIAIIITAARQNYIHPYGVENAWRWMAATMNLEPRSNITATFLHVFLEMSGQKLGQCYGLQFWKIVHLLNKDYLPKIEMITLPDFRGPVSRLKNYLEEVSCSGFKEPKGILTTDYWK